MSVVTLLTGDFLFVLFFEENFQLLKSAFDIAVDLSNTNRRRISATNLISRSGVVFARDEMKESELF